MHCEFETSGGKLRLGRSRSARSFSIFEYVVIIEIASDGR